MRVRSAVAITVAAAAVLWNTASARPEPPISPVNLDSRPMKEIAMQLVSSAENSSLDWRAQYAFLKDIGDGRGYTGGIIGFTSGTGDLLEVVELYTKSKPGNPLTKYLPALRRVNGTSSHAGLGAEFEADWKNAAKDVAFQRAQDQERDTEYFTPAVEQAKRDGLRALGQFAYYDAVVMHGLGNDSLSFGSIRKEALRHARCPAQGGVETVYLGAFLDARRRAMKQESAHDDTSRVDTQQRKFLAEGNLDLHTPLRWKTYGDSYQILKTPR
ncbi:MAG: chitosanase [Candidatus Eremiobacteraeota bacterium]|nr:chitosanase [Candidatus Eremiobacteraeota bacterium]